MFFLLNSLHNFSWPRPNTLPQVIMSDPLLINARADGLIAARKALAFEIKGAPGNITIDNSAVYKSWIEADAGIIKEQNMYWPNIIWSLGGAVCFALVGLSVFRAVRDWTKK